MLGTFSFSLSTQPLSEQEELITSSQTFLYISREYDVLSWSVLVNRIKPFDACLFGSLPIGNLAQFSADSVTSFYIPSCKTFVRCLVRYEMCDELSLY